MSLLPPPPPRRATDFSLATVNIVLLLVLFFLVAGTIVEQDETGIALPETTDLPLERLPRPLLRVTEAGGWVLDGTPMDRAEARAHLARTEPDRLYLLVARDMPADLLLATVAALDPAGVPLSLVTLRLRARDGPGGAGGAAP